RPGRSVTAMELSGRVGENRSRPVRRRFAPRGREDQVVGDQVAVLRMDRGADSGEGGRAADLLETLEEEQHVGRTAEDLEEARRPAGVADAQRRIRGALAG